LQREKYPGGFVRYQQDALQISKELNRSSPPTFIRLPILDFSTPELGALTNLLNQAASAITDQGSVIYGTSPHHPKSEDICTFPLITPMACDEGRNHKYLPSSTGWLVP